MNVTDYSGPEQPISSIEVAKYHDELLDCIGRVLANHGASLQIESCIDKFGTRLGNRYTIIFPDGTLKQSIYPIVTTDRYTITFPDGYVVYGHDSSRYNSPALVTFNFDDEFPTWVQEKYKRKKKV
jgi:hypothetical protein